ncbi:hypothetical protein C8R44DRAFT_735300 [Mycena epipterygia]|nr:hypothetical protein C8R44DRAFT_735300 [Mycena epipterygia]
MYMGVRGYWKIAVHGEDGVSFGSGQLQGKTKLTLCTALASEQSADDDIRLGYWSEAYKGYDRELRMTGLARVTATSTSITMAKSSSKAGGQGKRPKHFWIKEYLPDAARGLSVAAARLSSASRESRAKNKPAAASGLMGGSSGSAQASAGFLMA